jgi:hypothetical protein
MTRPVLPPLFVGPWIETTARIPMKGPHGTLTYLEPVIVPGEDGDTIEMRVHSRMIEAETFQTKADYDDEIHRDLARFGVDPRMEMVSVLSNEQVLGLHTRLLNKYRALGRAHAERVITRWQNAVRQWFPSLEFPVYIDRGQDMHQKILMFSNLIASDSRMGPAHWVVVSPKSLMYLEENPAFVYSEKSEIAHPNLVTFVGTLGNIKVFVNYNADWNSGDFVIGRDTRLNEPGVYFCEHTTDLAEVMTHERQVRLMITSRQALIHTSENAKYCYYANEFIYTKRPLWRRLLNL